MNPQKKLFYPVALPLLAVLLGCLVYGPALHAPFQFDDNWTIGENTVIKNIGNIMGIWRFDPSRFLTHVSFAVNYFFGGLSVFGYHAVNLVLHFLVAIVFYMFLLVALRGWLENSYGKKGARQIMFFAVLIFLAHPLQTESVTYISQRSTLLAALCYLLSLVFYSLYKKRGQTRYYLFALGAALIGAFTKPNIITLPFAILLYEICFFDLSKEKMKETVRRLAPFFLLIILVPLLLVSWKYKTFDLSRFLDATFETTKIERGHYFLTQANVVMTYLRLLVLPINQNLDYDYPIAKSFFVFPTYLSFAVLMGILTFAVKIFRMQRLVSFCIFWFFLTLSLESSVFPISDVIFEHRLYLPMVSFAVLLPFGLLKIIKNKEQFNAVMCVVILAFSFLTYMRNQTWSTKIGFLTDVAQKSPDKPRVHNNLAAACYDAGDIICAEKEYQKAMALDSRYAHPHNNLGTIYISHGQIKEAIAEFEAALRIKPRYEAPYYNLGNIYLEQGLLEKAEENYRKSLELRPTFAHPYAGLGNVYLKKKDRALAKFYFNEAIKMNPDFAFGYLGLADVSLNEGDLDLAVVNYKRAIEKKPDLVSAYNNLGNIYDIQERYEQAIRFYNAAIAIDPRYTNAYFNLANTLRKAGRIPEAVRALKVARGLYLRQKNEAMADSAAKRLKDLSDQYELNVKF